MKRILLLIFLVPVISNISFGQFTLTIEISSLRNNSGALMLQVYDSTENVISQQKGEIADNKCIISITDLKSGKYAVRYYHDENGNGTMDTNIMGKPLEGYGFSNNVTGKFGPPPFEKWLFEINSDKKIILKPTY
jgi:uncharacterized protein (DUF2141 family)